MDARGFLKISVVAFAIIIAGAISVYGLPTVQEVVSGDVEISTQDSTMTINASNNAIINFNSFDILQNEAVYVTLPSMDSQVLSRVTGGNMTNIMGLLDCNGTFYLVNTSGINIGENAVINAGSLVLSTRDITDSNFINGQYLFEKMSKEQQDMLLLNRGQINITEGGFGVLIAGAVENQGIITAPAGKIVLAGGDAIKLDISGRGLISVAILEGTASKI